MNKIRILTLMNALSFIIHSGLFCIFQFQLIKQNSVREINEPYDSLFVPDASITIKIWGVIYTTLALFCLYHIRMAYTHHEKHPANRDIAGVNISFIITNLAAAGWLVATMYGNLAASILLIVLQLLTLIKIHQRLKIYKRHRRAKSNICTQFPLTIYLGWLGMLTLAAFSAYFGLTTTLWTVMLIILLVIIALLVVFIRHNILYGLMIVTGLYGISLKTEQSKAGNADIILTAWIGIGILAISFFIKLIIDFRLKAPSDRLPGKVYD